MLAGTVIMVLRGFPDSRLAHLSRGMSGVHPVLPVLHGVRHFAVSAVVVAMTIGAGTLRDLRDHEDGDRHKLHRHFFSLRVRQVC